MEEEEEMSSLETNPPTQHPHPIFNAISSKDEASFTTLLQSDPSLGDLVDADFGSPLMYAIKLHCLPIASLLLEHRCDVNASDAHGQTALIMATKSPIQDIFQRSTNRVILKQLLDIPGLRLESLDAAGHSALMYAILQNNRDSVELLLKAKAEVNSPEVPLSPLKLSLAMKDPPIVHLLLKHNASTENLHPLPPLPRPISLLLDGYYTSLTHPLVVSMVTADICPVLGSSRIGMCMCPGRQNHYNWARDLQEDLRVIKELKTEILITLMTNEELTRMDLMNLFEEVSKVGMQSVHFPIPDKWLPDSIDEFCKVVYYVTELIKAGVRMVVHCNGGKGRTGLLVVGCLMNMGIPQNLATDIIRNIRPGMLRNPAQQVYLMWIEDKLKRDHQIDTQNQTPQKEQQSVVSNPPTPLPDESLSNQIKNTIFGVKDLLFN